jgi:hypothetical protein
VQQLSPVKANTEDAEVDAEAEEESIIVYTKELSKL